MRLLDAISEALDSAIRPPQPGRPDWLAKGDAEAARKDLASTPKPAAFEKVDQRMDRLTRELAEAAEERERLLALGRRHRQLQGAVIGLESRLAEAVESIAAIDTAAASAWGHAQNYFGDSYHRGVSSAYTLQALNCEAQANAAKSKLLPALEAELAAARAEVAAFARKHSIAEIEDAEAAAA